MLSKHILATLLLLGLTGLPALTVSANDNSDKSAEYYRCLEPRECRFEQWFVILSVGNAQGDISQQDIINDAANLGFDVFDVDFDDERTAYKLGVGLHLMSALELEAGFLDLGKVSTAFTTTTTQPDAFFQQTNGIRPLSADGPYLSANYKVINKTDWHLALKAGLFFWNGDYSSLNVFENRPVDTVSDGNGTDIFYGLGVSYHLSEQFDLKLGYEKYKFDEGKADVLNVGVTYLF